METGVLLSDADSRVDFLLVMIAANIASTPETINILNTRCMPVRNASPAGPAGSSDTLSRSEPTPREIITPATMAAETATAVTFAVLRTRFRNAAAFR